MAELITHPPIEPAAGQRVVLIALEDSAASDVCLRFALNESGVKAGDFVQILNVTSGHQTQQSSLAESPYEIFGGDGGRVPLVSDKQHPNPANEPSADFLYKRYEPALKAAGVRACSNPFTVHPERLGGRSHPYRPASSPWDRVQTFPMESAASPVAPV